MHTLQYNMPTFPSPKSEIIQELDPFMKSMEEISYWIITKRAPCLFNYDNDIKRKVEEIRRSKEIPKSNPTIEIVPPKKRKINPLNVSSVSTDKSQKIYFDKSHTKNVVPVPKNCTSDSLGSKVDFNITLREKVKRVKSQKKIKTIKNEPKLESSTSKISNIRRSLRTNNTQLNGVLQVQNTRSVTEQLEQSETQFKEETAINLAKNFTSETNGKINLDSSDVSGFTANYIRSTKVQSTKTTSKIQNKATKNQKLLKKDNTNEQILMCVNKSSITGDLHANLNDSTDSSQNIVNLVNTNQVVPHGIDKNTSVLEFKNVKSDETPVSGKKIDTLKNTTIQSKSSNSPRYPKRQRKISVTNSEKVYGHVDASEEIASPLNIPTSKYIDTEPKENSFNYISKTRSGKKIGLDMDPELAGYSMSNVNNSSEQVSSSITLNVGSQRTKSRKKNTQSRCLRSTNCKDKKKAVNRELSNMELCGGGSLIKHHSARNAGCGKKYSNETRPSSHKDSLRDKSGFTTCFSDSDSDNEPLTQRKFFL